MNRQMNSISPWLVILLTAPIPVVLCILLFFKWNEQKTDLARVTNYFVERQNTVLAYDAMRVSQRITQVLEKAERDLHALELLTLSRSKLLGFQSKMQSKLADSENPSSFKVRWLPTYLEVLAIDERGAEVLRVRDGKSVSARQKCETKKLCDYDLRVAILKSPVGSVRYGKLMRYYTPRTVKENHDGASLSVALRTQSGARIVSIDYQHLREILFFPTFPYEPRQKLLQSYLDGNYTYFVDDELDFVAHPKHWHVNGIEKETGKYVVPVGPDSELGTHPVNVQVYRGEQLKDYFNRLVHISFPNLAIDLFRAPNLTGKIRVHAVAPIILRKGQFTEKGIFGHVITGCYVDYFEEPKEQFLPYY